MPVHLVLNAGTRGLLNGGMWLLPSRDIGNVWDALGWALLASRSPGLLLSAQSAQNGPQDKNGPAPHINSAEGKTPCAGI